MAKAGTITLGKQTVTRNVQDQHHIVLPAIHAEKDMSFRAQRARLPLPLRIITSPAITSAGAGIAVAAATGNPVAAVSSYLTVGTVLGLVESSPKAASAIGKRLAHPTEIGEFFGPLIENPNKFYQENKGKILTALGISAVAATAAGIPYVVEQYKKRKKAAENFISNPALPTDTGQSGGLPFGPTNPVGPTVEETARPRRRRHKNKRLERQGQKISQSVRVNVIQRNSANRITKFIRNTHYQKAWA